MIRTASFSLKFSNTEKQNQLRKFVTEYISVVNFLIEKLWDEKIFYGRFVSANIYRTSKSWLSARAKCRAGNQALRAVKSQRKKRRKTMPVVINKSVELSQSCITFLSSDNSFDEFVMFSPLGNKFNKLKIICPVKYHKHYNELREQGFVRKKSARLREYNGNLYLDVFMERGFVPYDTNKTIGIDLGIKKLMVDSDGNRYGEDIERLLEKSNRKVQKSKAFYRSLRERDNYMNRTVKELPRYNFVLEDLKGLHKDTKRRTRKKFRTKLHRWTYSKLLDRIKLRAEVVGVQCQSVSPAYTSQECSICGYIHKSNRTGEIFSCRNCGYKSDADLNASRNILNRSLAHEPAVRGSI